MKVNISKAAEMVGKTRATLYRHIEKKGITVEKDDDDNPLIDVSELVRVYGDRVNIETVNEQNNTKENTGETVSYQQNKHEIELLKKQMQLFETSTVRERDLLESQIEHLKESLSKAQDGQYKLTLLLEDHTKKRDGDSEWQKSFKALENRIANQEKEAKEREVKEQKLLDENRRIKQAYSKQKKAFEEEKGKSVWKKLFG